jgi:hypothetical protein
MCFFCNGLQQKNMTQEDTATCAYSVNVVNCAPGVGSTGLVRMQVGVANYRMDISSPLCLKDFGISYK